MDKKKEFEEKFCGRDDDSNELYLEPSFVLMPEELWAWIDQAITDACKRQREICASIYDEGVTNAVLDPSAMTFMYSKIKNAPSPTKESE